MMKKILVLVLCLFSYAPLAYADSTYYVVRHAEKVDGDNPVLTAKGVRRAAHISRMLANTHLDGVYSTDTNRTIMTATATAVTRGLQVVLFSTDDLNSFSDMLKAKDGTYLIVAHSSSTPDLAALLSGVAIPKLEETDYEQLFKVVITDGATELTKMITTFE